MTPLPPRFPPELLEQVEQGLSRRGFHFLSGDELQSFFPLRCGQASRLARIREFAEVCGATFETDLRFSTARLERPVRTRRAAVPYMESWNTPGRSRIAA